MEQLISFETAIIAKEKGFKWLVTNYVKLTTLSDKPTEEVCLPQNINKIPGSVFSRPSQAVLQKWLREKHKVFVESNVDQRGSFNHRLETYFTCEIKYRRSLDVERNYGMGHICYATFDSYENAVENALKNALKELDRLTYTFSTKQTIK